MEHFNYRKQISNIEGFTLIEVLIAITVLSFISFFTYKMVDTNTDTKERVIKEDHQVVQTLTAIGRLDSDITQLYNPLFSYAKPPPTAQNADIYDDQATNSANGPFAGKTINGALIPQFKSEEKSSLIFFTQANRRKMADTKESRFAWVKYSIQPMEVDPDEPEKKVSGLYDLVRQTVTNDIYNSNLDWNKPKPQVIMERVKDVEFSFWDERTKKYVTSLQDLNENKNTIRSIKMVLTWVDDDTHEQKIEKTFRILTPYFNTKLDDIKTTGAFGAGGAPPGTPDPTQPGGSSVQY